MSMLGGSSRQPMVWAGALALGAVFLYAGIDKIHDPLHFSDSINAFAILPPALIDVSALALPIFEIVCAILVFLPPTRRVGALALMLASSMFFVALLSALLRGLTLDCGCFGTGVPSRSRMWVELGLDALLVGGAAFTYFHVIMRPLGVSTSNDTSGT
jgi:putative oxidoreductase